MPGKDETKDNMNKALFASLIMMLSSSVMQQLGKLVNPLTNKTEPNLEGAQVTIDLLAMLQEKTKGNLDKDEQKMIDDTLSSLQMNYVETSKDISVEEKDKTSDAKEQVIADKAEADSSSPSDSDEKKDPKFHKSYGE